MSRMTCTGPSLQCQTEPLRSFAWRHLPARALLAALLVAAAPVWSQDISVTAPTEAETGSQFSVSYSGTSNPRDFITIVKPELAEGQYGAYQYTRESPLKLQAPPVPGDYEIRYLSADSPYPTLWRQALKVTEASATLQGPQTIAAGSALEIAWTGPNNPQDFITIVSAGAAEGTYKTYQYTQSGSPVTLTAPDVAGDYEVRYLMGLSPYRTLTSMPLKVTSTEASITAPAEVPAGALVTFEWQGPDNAQDFITVVPANAPDKDYDRYVYTQSGSPAELLAPDTPGDYELRYLTGQSYAVLARAPLRTTAVTASVQGPQSIEALSPVLVGWEGPGNPQDYVIIQPIAAEVSAGGQYAYVSRGPELRITAPTKPGQYEYRYVTGQSNLILARQAVTVTPRTAPGTLKVVDGSGSAGAAGGDPTGEVTGSGVIVVLDASGSMLQRLDGKRRIDIAKASLRQLIQQDLPDHTRFGLRVFGHKEADSCRTDLEITLGPLNRSEAAAKVEGITAMNLAKTPIADTLAKAGEDLAGQPGPNLIILVTDGEETCDGDPAAVITSLREGGLDVRVNIVGFAIDELMLRESFARWAELGGGQYIDARNAAELSAGLSSAIERPFEVLAADGSKVASGLVNGLALELPPGEYRVKIAGSEALPATVKADEESVVSLD
jgi:hypothetical protein